jgi:hypothetical protein
MFLAFVTERLLRFPDKIFFLEPVIPDIIAAVTEVVQHSFYCAATAAETDGSRFHGPEPVFGDQLQYVVQPLFI